MRKTSKRWLPRFLLLAAASLLISVPAQACRFVDDADGVSGGEAVSGGDAVSRGDATPAPTDKPAPEVAAPPQAPAAATLDFDLLGKAPEGNPMDAAAIKRRRTLLNWHQGVGLAMFGIALANTVVGQLNYSDRFASGPSSGRYELAHEITVSATLLAFAGTGVLALLAPTPIQRGDGFGRLTVHKIAMATATAGLVAETALGLYTASREGYQNQPNFAAAHLVIGYLTFAAIAAGVGVIVF